MTTPKIAIVTDSSCDLSDAQLKEYGIRMISLRVICQKGEYRDRIDLSQEQLIEIMKHELPKTSLPLPEDVSALYDELFAEGYTDVLHLCISSGLSGTYNMVRIIAEDYQNKLNIQVVDSLTLSTGLGLMTLTAAQAIRDGVSVQDVLPMLQKVRKDCMAMFTIKTLDYLRKGGRIGMVEGMLGNFLNIKPVIYVDDNGVYQTLTKARGYKNAIESMVTEVKRFYGDAKVRLTVVHNQALEDAQKLMERLQAELKVQEGAFIASVSPVLAVHTGPGLIGVVGNRV